MTTLRGEREFYTVSPPQAEGEDSPNAIVNVDVLVAASAAIDLGIDIPQAGAWFTFQSSVAAAIAFAAADTVVATVDCWPMTAGVEYRWYCAPESSRYFSVIRLAGDGVLSRYCSQPNKPSEP